MKKQHKSLLILVLVVIVVLGFVGSTWRLEVLSVDRIWLHQRGVGEAGEELKGGYWRVTATSQNTKIQFLQLNEDVMKANQEFSGDFPSDVQVNGEIYVTVSQPYNPYWIIPIVDEGIVEVVPEYQGVHYGSGGYSGPTLADSVSVHLWSLNLAQKRVIVPFEVTAGKIFGENVGWLKTNDSRGKQIANPDNYVTYLFEISQSDIVDGETSNIVFYNPNNPEETLKINLQWVFGDYDKYSWNENFLFVTPEVTNFPPIPEVTFLASDEQAIKQQLNWQSGSDWTFNRYWYGGGNIFKGTTVYSSLHGLLPIKSNIIEQSGKSTAMIAVPDIGSKQLLSEGYVSSSTTTTGIYEYAGWYTPHPDAVELWGDAPSNWEDWRYPLTPNILSNTESTPDGQSIVNYLASAYYTPVTGLTHTGFSRRTPDVWGYGSGGNIGVNGYITVVLPTAAREWLFTLDVSTELADTVVIREDYIDVSITKQLSFDRYTLNAGETATGTVKLKNNSPFSGTVSVGIKAPDNLKYTVEISGGDGNLYFASGEEKTVSFTIKNTGLLDEQQSGTFTFSVINQEPRKTASQTFTMTFKPGIGVPDSLLDVTTKDGDTGEKVSGITIKAVYGVDEHSKTGTTTNGECVLDLGKFEGSVTVSAIDYQGRYESEETIVQVVSGSNPVTFHLIRKGSGTGDDWAMVALILGIAGMATVLLFYYMKRRKR